MTLNDTDTQVEMTLSEAVCVCFLFKGAVEPMQIDADPQEDQQNAPDANYVVENPTLVCTCLNLTST